jgi:hypothetical protein
MKAEDLKNRIDTLLSQMGNTSGHELFQAALSLVTSVYGAESPQARTLLKEAEQIGSRYSGAGTSDQLVYAAEGALQNLRGEIEAGLIGNLRKTLTGEVLSDFVQLARLALNETTESAKNVAAVLSAAVYEDTMRRLAESAGISHNEKLADTLTELKNKGILQGAQVGIANSYLNFRNSALHAQWERIDREAVVSVLGFVEQLLIKHFS